MPTVTKGKPADTAKGDNTHVPFAYTGAHGNTGALFTENNLFERKSVDARSFHGGYFGARCNEAKRGQFFIPKMRVPF